MTRTAFSLVVCLFVGLVQSPAPAADSKPLALGPGPQLFIDDYLIDKSEGVTRKVTQPQRFLKEPVVTGKDHRNWQPWCTVLHNPANPAKQRFRMWYNAYLGNEEKDNINGYLEGRPERMVLGYLESEDGVNWPTPMRHLSSIKQIIYDACVIDEGSQFPTPAERYKLVFWHDKRDKNNQYGPHVAFSPDGLEWTEPEGATPIIPNRWDGSWFATYDHLRQRYLVVGKIWDEHTWINAEGQTIKRHIRKYGVSFSKDFKKWSEQKVVFVPDDKDQGMTDWYGCTGYQHRGDLIVAFVQVLRDDLTSSGSPPEVLEHYHNPGAGIGYTVLAWSRDGGETWHRDRHTDKFLDTTPEPGAWDHAMAWVTSSANVGDEVYLYYAGYKWGHKWNRPTERNFGLVKVLRDRYVARQAGPQGGTLTTRPFTFNARALTLNAVAAGGGEVRVEVCDASSGTPITGYALADCKPITGDALAAPAEWKDKSMGDLHGREVRLRFSLKNASLYALELAN